MLRVMLFGLLLFVCNPVQGQHLEDQLKSESLEELAASVESKGDPKRGASVFYRENLSCFRCHDAIDGRRLGPQLTEKREVTTAHLVESLLHPSSKIREGFEQYVLQLADGRIVSGLIASQDDDWVYLDRIEEPGKPLQISRDDIDGMKLANESSMPAGLVNQLEGRQDFLDLVAYLDLIANQGPGIALQLKPINAGQVIPLPEYEADIDHGSLIQDVSAEVLKTGADIYRLKCASCHGDLEHEGSMPTSLRFASGKFKRGGDPYSMYQTVTHGLGMMIPQRSLVPRQKYAVIHYIRAHFVKPHNPGQFAAVNSEYLASLPKGKSLGPEAKSGQPWTAMNYGPSFINTVEVPVDSQAQANGIQNIAQKGIIMRLDAGTGGVSEGNLWCMFDHDTMRMSAIWDGQFIDYNGIHFNGVHGRHPKVTGRVLFANSDGPGWADPVTGKFDDDQRVEGRDGRRYGPLPVGWSQYRGMYRYGDQTLISYSIGETSVLETPYLQTRNGSQLVVRQLEIGPRKKPLTLQITEAPNGELLSSNVFTVTSQPKAEASSRFDGAMYFQSDVPHDKWLTEGYVVEAKIRTQQDGTILAMTEDQPRWLPNGQTFFVRGRKLAFDIGWVGALAGQQVVADGKWHTVKLVYDAAKGNVEFYVDGQLDASGKLRPKDKLQNPVLRIGYTNENFPAKSSLKADLESLSVQNLPTSDSVAKLQWHQQAEKQSERWERKSIDSSSSELGFRFVACVDSEGQVLEGLATVDDSLRLNIPAGSEPLNVRVVLGHSPKNLTAEEIQQHLAGLPQQDLQEMTSGGPTNWPQTLESSITSGPESGGFITDTFTLPNDNPWNCRLRLSGIDFAPAENVAYICSWDGGVWKVTGIGNATGEKVQWKRIAAGLFQPLGIKLRDGVIFVTCRDQLVALHDLNEDGEMDWYQCFNNDHQVTPHFHEFAMGLQTDQEGNFYYAKSARHALKAVVPHHGTLLKVSSDGATTDIVANGFRAANGVCLNPDGSFVVTDQEGHWNPKNRINWVQPGQFYGNMFGYHDVEDESDEAMTQPLCWITNEFDRSPAELLWVESDKWGPLNGSLLNLSYGYGKAYVVPFEEVDGQKQGGMCAFDMPAFPTGIMRGRFRPEDGQLYCCGLFAWSSTQETPGGLYRVRATGNAFHLPVELNARHNELSFKFTESLLPESVKPENFAVKVWDLKRSANYGSAHYNEHSLEITSAELAADGKTVILEVSELAPTWGMEIVFSLKDADGVEFENRIHNSIYQLPKDSKIDAKTLESN